MVKLTRIYTGGGDAGDTHLGDMSRTRKTATRVVAYGEVDEANSAVGLARSSGIGASVDARLAQVQNDLFDVGADLSVPGVGTDRLRLRADQAKRLESWIDEINEDLPDLTSFVLPAGSPSAAALHLARSVTRRAERAVVALAEDEEINEAVIVYMNRLSDLLFVLARQANQGAEGDVLWSPGAAPGP
jgi:cob(I)alamin adenosyltransferase